MLQTRYFLQKYNFYFKQKQSFTFLRSWEKKLFISSYHRELTKLVLIFNFLFNIRRKLSIIRCIHDFTVFLKTGTNPANINRFRSCTWKCYSVSFTTHIKLYSMSKHLAFYRIEISRFYVVDYKKALFRCDNGWQYFNILKL